MDNPEQFTMQKNIGTCNLKQQKQDEISGI